MTIRDVCVIGAGIVGTSIAFQLSRYSGTRVTIIDSGYPGAGTTDAGTGWVNARTPDPEYRRLRLLAMEEHHRLAGLFPASPWLVLGGVLMVEGHEGELDALVESYRAASMPAEILSGEEVNARLEPHLVFPRREARAAHFTDEFGVAGSLLARTLFTAAVENGAVAHLGSAVTGLEQLARDRHRVRFADGTELLTGVVVNAAGARADTIAAHYDVPMPLLPQPGIGIHVSAPGNPLRRMVMAGGLAAKPEPDGVIKLRSMVGWSAGAAERDNSFTGGMERGEFVRHVVSQLEHLVPHAAPIAPIASRVGIRPFPADGLPRVGAVDSVPGYYEAVTHSGATLAPLLGRLLAEEIVTGVASPLLASYRPARFLTTSLATTGTGA